MGTALEEAAMLIRCWSAFLVWIMISGAAAREKPLPTVVLVGDSIRMGYAPFVAKLLAGKAIVVSPRTERRGQWQRSQAPRRMGHQGEARLLST